MPLRNCVAVDKSLDVRPDVCADALALPFASASTEYVYCSHLIEHFPPAEGRQLLQELFRVLRPGGVLHLTVPSLEWACLNLGLGPEPMKVLYGGQKDESDFHKWGYTAETLLDVLVDVGFVVQSMHFQYYQINVVATKG